MSMMRNNSLLKWTTAHRNNKNNKNSGKNWIHAPEVLQGGHVVYLVKFLGNTEVSQSKGIEVVKEAIRKLRFNQQIKKSEGTKTPKVELTISVDGVAIQQPKSKKILSQYPLHNISYCADDKAEKRFFSFIAKEPDGEEHTCYVFVSDKLAEEITLTIGQAFDLAYKRFLETSSREIDLRRQIASLQSQLRSTQTENTQLRAKLQGLPYGNDGSNETSLDLLEMNGRESATSSPVHLSNGSSLTNLPPVPPRNNVKNELIIEALLSPTPENYDDDFDFDPRAIETPDQSKEDLNQHSPPQDNQPQFTEDSGDDFDPRAEEESEKNSDGFDVFHIRSANESPLSNGGGFVPSLLPPPPPTRTSNGPTLFHQNSIPNENRQPSDPFALHNNANLLDKFDEMKIGFNRGISFGTTDEDFTLESLDPLKN